MFEKILVGIDGSDISLRAVEKAISIAKSNNAELHAIYVVEKIPLAGNIDSSIKSQVDFRLVKDGSDVLNKALEMAEKENCEIMQHIGEGSPGHVIIDVSEEIGCDLIVVGSLGHSVIGRLLLGSVSSYVVNNSTMNVLVIRD